MGLPEPLASLQRLSVRLYATIKSGVGSRDIPPKNQIKNLGERPALIMHSTGDSQVPYPSFERIVANAPAHVETWVRDGDLHFTVEQGKPLTPR